MSRLSVVGFGLLGSSFAAAQRAAESSLEVTAIDCRAVLDIARARQLAAHFVDSSDEDTTKGALEDADLVFVATPVLQATERIASYVDAAELITDAASTKRFISRAASASARRGHFVPGHPMAGAPRGGIENGRADLFAGCTWILCPELATGTATLRVEGWLRRIGASIVHMTAEEHDRAVALTSHVPQLLASTLAALGRAQGAEIAGGPVFRELTRTAGGPLSIWRDIFATNPDNVAAALGALIATLEGVRAELDQVPASLVELERLLLRARDL